MDSLLHSVWLLPLAPLFLRALPLHERRDAPWRTSTDLGLAALLGATTALVAAFYLAPQYSSDSAASFDFPSTCLTVARFLTDVPAEQMVIRQAGAALLPALLAMPLGIMDGLAAGALLSAAAVGASLYLWGRALCGRTAGVVAAVMGVAMVPHVVLPRFLGFYPELAAGCALCVAGAAMALRWRTGAALGAAGAGAGLALLADHPGLLYALPMMALCAVVACAAPRRRVPLRLVALLLPVVLSWVVARAITQPTIQCFEAKISAVLADVHHARSADLEQWSPQRGQGIPGFGLLQQIATRPRDFKQFAGHPGAGYRWGYSGPLQIVRTLAALALLPGEFLESDGAQRPATAAAPGGVPDWSVEAAKRTRHDIIPWVLLALVGLVPALVWLRRRPLEALGLLVLILPFALSLATMSQTQVWNRYLMAPMIPVPVLAGVAWAALALRRGGPDAPPVFSRLAPVFSRLPPALGRLPPALVSGVLASLLVLGWIPSWLSPRAPWRLVPLYLLNEEHREVMGQVETRLASAAVPGNRHAALTAPRSPDQWQQTCVDLLVRDRQGGHPAGSRLYPRSAHQSVTPRPGPATGPPVAAGLPPPVSPRPERELSAGERALLAAPPTGRSLGVKHVALSGARSMRFVGLTGGEFTMGSPQTEQGRYPNSVESPRHRVKVPAFLMAEAEVTRGQWAAVFGGQAANGGDVARTGITWCDAARFANALSAREKLTPVYTVSDTCESGGEVAWDRSADGYRLPTEAEWEYAARAGTTMPFWSGDDEKDLTGAAWFGTTSGPHPVKGKSANPWGLYDVHGNVAEWVWDWYGPYPVPADGSQPASTERKRDLRGGSWSDRARRVRSAFRSRRLPSHRHDDLGLRLARSAPPAR